VVCLTSVFSSCFLLLQVVEAVPDVKELYLSEIKHPMDLSTMKKKMTSYRSLEEFEMDVKLMLSNCMTFNTSGHYYDVRTCYIMRFYACCNVNAINRCIRNLTMCYVLLCWVCSVSQLAGAVWREWLKKRANVFRGVSNLSAPPSPPHSHIRGHVDDDNDAEDADATVSDNDKMEEAEEEEEEEVPSPVTLKIKTKRAAAPEVTVTVAAAAPKPSVAVPDSKPLGLIPQKKNLPPSYFARDSESDTTPAPAPKPSVAVPDSKSLGLIPQKKNLPPSYFARDSESDTTPAKATKMKITAPSAVNGSISGTKAKSSGSNIGDIKMDKSELQKVLAKSWDFLTAKDKAGIFAAPVSTTTHRTCLHLRSLMTCR
jgi:hypothetical protein